MNALVTRNVSAVEILVDPGADELKAALVERSQPIVVVDAATLPAAVAVLREIKAATAGMERARAEAKGPILDMGRRIDSIARDWSESLNAEAQRVNGLVTAYQADQARLAAEAERKRQNEIARIERERQAAERAAAERARIEAEEAARKRLEIEQAAAAKAAAELAAANTEKERAVAEARAKLAAESARRAEEKAAAEREMGLERERQRLAAEAAAAARQAAPIVPTVHTAGLVTRDVWEFTVTDIRALAWARLDLVTIEPRTREINSAIAAGMRTCPGLTITKTVKTHVRQ